MQKVNDNKVLGSRNAILEEKIHATINHSTPIIVAAVRRYLAPLGASTPQVEVTTQSLNSIEGQLDVRVRTAINAGSLDYGMAVPFVNGAPVISETLVVNAFAAAKEAFEKAPHTIQASAQMDKMPVDLGQIKAERIMDSVHYSSPELPRWQFVATVDSLKTRNNHILIQSQLLSSIRGYCLTDYYMAADFKQKDFRLPVVASEAKAAPAPYEIPGFEVPKNSLEAERKIIESNLMVRGSRPAQGQPKIEAGDSWRSTFEASVRRKVLPLIEGYVTQVLKGSIPQIVAVDYTNTRQTNSGVAAGKAIVSVKFYGNQSLEAMDLEVPFDEMGNVDIAKIAKGAATLEAEKLQAEELKILTDKEAAEQMASYREHEQQLAAEMIQAGLGIEGGDGGHGQNVMKQPVADRIPVLKAHISPDLKVGDKIMVRSYVYQICASDYNSPDVEHGAFYMLCLTNDMPSEKLPSFSSLWGSMGNTMASL